MSTRPSAPVAFPLPSLPAGVIERTRARYAEALQKLAGIDID